jgi:uncharacterized metal-binding protein YceD (DUF177 family)
VKELNKYNIDIVGLEDKQYVYDQESGDAFFEEMNQDFINHGNFRVITTLDKSTTMIQLQFQIEGSVELTCDRSLETFNEPVQTEGRMFLKFGDRDEELTEEIEIIHRNTTRINIARYIFDLIVLSLPMKRIHPDLRKEESDDETETLVYSSTPAATETQEEESPSETIDPRWEALKKLKN